MLNNETLHNTLQQLVETLYRQGLRQVVLSPGSRSAPLALAFMRHQADDWELFHLVDERSAGYFALGLSKKNLVPAILVCTSGTAALNYAPAVAEAYFQQVPLLLFTADRPPELIGQNDNQAIFQKDLYGKHVLAWHQMPDDFQHAAQTRLAQRMVNQALLTSVGQRMGPVHVNFPFREPFYPNGENAAISSTKPLEPLVLDVEPSRLLPQWHEQHHLVEAIQQAQHIWIVGGQSHETAASPLRHLINHFCACTGALYLGDPLTGLHIEQQCYHFDEWLQDPLLQTPDVVISFGNHFLSKNIKQVFKAHPPEVHVHVQTHEDFADPFFSVHTVMQAYLLDFFESLQPYLPGRSLPEYHQNLLERDKQLSAHWQTTLANLPSDADEWLQVGKLLGQIPENSVLHLGNSSPVRYLLKWQFLLREKGVEIHANRGTSGIDGCVSTAMGMAQNDERCHILLIGDLAMMYDRNGLWHQHLPQRFHVVVVNNYGGGIFRKIQGPSQQPELETYFVNAQPTDFAGLANMHGFQYQKWQQIPNGLDEYFKSPNRTLTDWEVPPR